MAAWGPCNDDQGQHYQARAPSGLSPAGTSRDVDDDTIELELHHVPNYTHLYSLYPYPKIKIVLAFREVNLFNFNQYKRILIFTIHNDVSPHEVWSDSIYKLNIPFNDLPLAPGLGPSTAGTPMCETEQHRRVPSW